MKCKKLPLQLYFVYKRLLVGGGEIALTQGGTGPHTHRNCLLLSLCLLQSQTSESDMSLLLFNNPFLMSPVISNQSLLKGSVHFQLTRLHSELYSTC